MWFTYGLVSIKNGLQWRKKFSPKETSPMYTFPTGRFRADQKIRFVNLKTPKMKPPTTINSKISAIYCMKINEKLRIFLNAYLWDVYFENHRLARFNTVRKNLCKLYSHILRLINFVICSSTTPQQCCGKVLHDVTTHQCCAEKVAPKVAGTHTKCCQETTYDSRRESCCNREVTFNVAT